MDRKKFILAAASLPLLGIPFKALATSFAAKNICQTQRDAEGPFYKANAPERSVIETEGVPLQIKGTVYTRDCRTPVADAILDIWHCDHEGHYDMRGFKARGQLKTGPDGSYRFVTIFPPPYGTRPRHIHIKVRARGQRELTTQIYFKGDPNIKNDFARSAKEDRVISLQSDKTMKTGVFDIYL